MGFINEEALAETIQKTIADKLSSDAITAQIEKTLEKTVAEAINDALKSWSDTGKAIKTAIEEAIQIDSQIGLPSYNETVKRIVKEMVEQHVAKIGAEQLQKDIDEMFEPAPAEIKVSELLEKFAEGTSEFQDEGGVELVIFHEESEYGYHHFAFDVKESYRTQDSWHHCNYQLHWNKEMEIYSLKVDGGKDITKGRPFMLGREYNFDRMMINLYANKTKIVMDEDADYLRTEYGPRYA